MAMVTGHLIISTGPAELEREEGVDTEGREGCAAREDDPTAGVGT